MVSRKYLKDYRIEEYIDANGRVRSEAVYIGGDYTLMPQVSTGDKRLILLLSVLSGSFYCGALLPVTRAARLTYVIMPLVLSALPIFLMISAAVSLLSVKEAMPRPKAEKISNRLPPSALITAILSGAAFFGLIITAAAAWDGVGAGDYIFSACSLAIFLAAATVFIKSRKLKTTQLLHASRADNNNNKEDNKNERHIKKNSNSVACDSDAANNCSLQENSGGGTD